MAYAIKQDNLMAEFRAADKEYKLAQEKLDEARSKLNAVRSKVHYHLMKIGDGYLANTYVVNGDNDMYIINVADIDAYTSSAAITIEEIENLEHPAKSSL